MNAKNPKRLIAFALIISTLSCGEVEKPVLAERSGKDTDPPAAIGDAVLVFNDSLSQAVLSWSSPSDDSPAEAVKSYQIRYSSSLFALRNWELAAPILDAPEPLPPGARQSYFGFKHVEKGKNLYAAIKSVDEAGNESPMSNIASAHVPGFSFLGRCVNLYSSSPIRDLRVTMAAGNNFRFATDGSGTFLKDDLYAGRIFLSIATGNASTLYHTFSGAISIAGDTAMTIPMIPFEPTESGDFRSILSLFKTLTLTAGGGVEGTALLKWRNLPVKCYIPAFTNTSGTDYAVLAIQAATRWMTASGIELFNFVDYDPDTGIVISYKTQAEMGILKAITRHTNMQDGHPLKDTIEIADYFSDSSFVYKVFLHEFGHTLRFGHINNPEYIMYLGQPLPSEISLDEINVVRLWHALPDGTLMESYDENSP